VDHGIISGTACQSSRQHEGIRLTDCGMIDTAPAPDFAARRARLAMCPFKIDRMIPIMTKLIDLDKGMLARHQKYGYRWYIITKEGDLGCLNGFSSRVAECCS
jgi:hypothetical protein